MVQKRAGLKLLALCQFLMALEFLVFLSLALRSLYANFILLAAPFSIILLALLIISGFQVLKPTPFGVMFSLFSWTGLIYFIVSLMAHRREYGFLANTEKAFLYLAFVITGLGIVALVLLILGKGSSSEFRA